MNVTGTNNVGIGSGVRVGALHPSLASPNPPPLLSLSHASRGGSGIKTSAGGYMGHVIPRHLWLNVRENETGERIWESGWSHDTKPGTPTDRCTAMDPRARSYRPRQTSRANRLWLSPTPA